MTDSIIQDKLNDVFEKSEIIPLNEHKRIIVFSDLHMGNGSSTDDFQKNSELFYRVLHDYYLKKDYTLILNGDIEELQRFTLQKIEIRWADLYELFDEFDAKGCLFKTVGNHDYELYSIRNRKHPYRLYPAIKLKWNDNYILVLHGHQASNYFEQLHTLIGHLLRYVANPLKIKNRSVAHNSRKKFKTEREVYAFGCSRKIITMIGHTHRPLFESLSKIDELKYRIENLVRKYPGSDTSIRKEIEEQVEKYKTVLAHLYEKHEETSLLSSLYNQLVIPSLFNSGCVIGKRSITGLEIDDGKIALVQWFNGIRNERKVEPREKAGVIRLADTDVCKVELKKETLEYVFARIMLLL